MKIQLLSIVSMICFCSVAAFAQVSIGVKGGANWSNVQSATKLPVNPNFKSIQNYTAGIVLDIPLNRSFSVQPEVNYTTKGFGFSESRDLNVFNVPLPLGIKTQNNVNYIEMPLLLKYKLGNDVAKAYIAAGPTFGYALNGEYVGTANVIVNVNAFKTAMNFSQLNYQRLDMGAALGIGGEVATGNTGALFVEARYQHGLTTLYKVPVIDVNVQNRGIAVTAGYRINLGSRNDR
jgi:Outer membrane protein beta-barrel domain